MSPKSIFFFHFTMISFLSVCVTIPLIILSFKRKLGIYKRYGNRCIVMYKNYLFLYMTV